MPRVALIVLGVAIVVDLAATCWAAAVGVRDFAWLPTISPWGIVTDTALDCAVLAAVRAICVPLLLCCLWTLPVGDSSLRKVAATTLAWLHRLSIWYYAPKAVLVAMYGGLDMEAGQGLPVFLSAQLGVSASLSLSPLPLVYVSLGISTVCCFAEQICSCLAASVSNASAAGNVLGIEDSSVAEPLLREQTNGMAGTVEEAAGSDTQGDQRKMAPASDIIKALVSLTAPDWPVLSGGFFFGALAAWTQALIPFYIGRIIDATTRSGGSEIFMALVRSLLEVAVACAVFTGCRGSLFTLEFAFLNQRIRSRLFTNLMDQDVAFYDRGKTGDVISRLSADVQSVSDSICLNTNVLSRSALQAAVVLYFMFAESEESWRLSVMTFVLVPVILAICKVYGGYYRVLQVDIQTALAGASSVAEEMVGSMTTVKAHAGEASARGSYFGKLREVFSLQRKQAGAYLIFMVIQTFLPNAMSALVLYYGGSLIAQGKMNSGSLVSFMLYQQSLSAAFQNMGDVFSNLSGAVGAAEKVVELLGRRPEIPPCQGLVPDNFHGEIELRNVRFAYPTRLNQLVLDGFDLKIKAGEVVALVGPSGGGKSSIVKLMQRFYVPLSGQVLYDGRDVGEYDPAWLRQKVAMVGQEPVLYARSIYDNIVFGLPEGCVPTKQEVEEAAKLANAHDFVTSLPKGYDTTCGDKGVQMSGGQKQRIAIARALVRKPEVLLLDEATSALDADSEHIVQEALDRVMRGRTVVVIAHRLSTVQDADRIIVVQKGRSAEQGSHSQLVSRGGAYAVLVSRQLTRGKGSLGSFSSLQSLAHQAA